MSMHGIFIPTVTVDPKEKNKKTKVPYIGLNEKAESFSSIAEALSSEKWRGAMAQEFAAFSLHWHTKISQLKVGFLKHKARQVTKGFQ